MRTSFLTNTASIAQTDSRYVCSALRAACVSEFPIIFSKSPFPVLRTATYKQEQIYAVMTAGVNSFSPHVLLQVHFFFFLNRTPPFCDLTAKFLSFDKQARATHAVALTNSHGGCQITNLF